MLRPGMRLAVGLSGGADSVALLRTLAERSRELGLVLHAAHLHHGLRGEEADKDLEFARALAAKLGVPLHGIRVDVAAESAADRHSGKAAESIEEAARRVRYAWFKKLLSEVPLDAVATAHTLDDQAETVLAKFLRGAWTEGLGGISPVLEFTEGRVLRPLLNTTRPEIEAYLEALGQDWREDSSNRNLTFTRNRIRHELLPLLENFNPRLREHLAHMAELARGEEAWWEAEVNRVAQQVVLTGKPVRGGGRTGAGGLAIDLTRFAGLAAALQRRILRRAAEQIGVGLDFAGTEALRNLALDGRAGQKCELEGLRGERTARELRLEAGPASSESEAGGTYKVAIPGEVEATGFGLRIRIEGEEGGAGILRAWAPGDRVRLRYSGAPRKVKEILERLKVTGSDRVSWPVLEVGGRIVWMKGVEVEPEPALTVKVEALVPTSNLG